MFGKALLALASGALVVACASSNPIAQAPAETQERMLIAAANLQDAVVIDCQLPGRLVQLGGSHTYLTPGALLRLSAIECRTRGGEYTVGDLASGTLSLNRWLPLAQKGDAEAQYYVARIYANGMSGVPADYTKAAEWYQKAVDQHYSSAMQELGFMFERGLGVPQDSLRALNLQRQASGLGEDLDYESKIGAAQEEAAKQVADFAGRLEASNAELESLRAQLSQSSTALTASQERLRKSQTLVAGLRDQLDQAKSAVGADPARLAQLESQLAAKQGELAVSRRDLDAAKATMSSQQSDISAKLAKSQATSLQLTELLAARQGETSSLRAQLAQSEQRFLHSQQELAAVRADFRASAAELTAERDTLAKSKGRDDGARLAAKQQELERKSQRIASLETETAALRQEMDRVQTQAGRTAAGSVAESQRLKDALNAAQQKIAEQRDRLDKLQTESAAENAALALARANLQAAFGAGQRDSNAEVASLKADIHERELVIAAKAERINALEKQLSDKPILVANNVTFRNPEGLKPAATDMSKVLPVASASFQALIIGNSNYRLIGGLATPAHDAQAIADLMESRYGFKVKLLLDATSDQIMRTLHDYTLSLNENDRLLVYYAGHGGTQDGPPERAFWLGVDADPETQNGWISSETIRAKIKQMNAKHVLLVADSCFSAAITHPTTTTIGRGITERRFQVQWNRRARMVLTSGQNTPVVDSTGDRNHSLFAKYFIQVLRQNDNIMSGEMLSHELSARMLAESSRLGIRQTPTYSSLGDANHDFGDFFFMPSQAAKVAALVQ